MFDPGVRIFCCTNSDCGEYYRLATSRKVVFFLVDYQSSQTVVANRDYSDVQHSV